MGCCGVVRASETSPVVLFLFAILAGGSLQGTAQPRLLDFRYPARSPHCTASYYGRIIGCHGILRSLCSAEDGSNSRGGLLKKIEHAIIRRESVCRRHMCDNYVPLNFEQRQENYIQELENSNHLALIPISLINRT